MAEACNPDRGEAIAKLAEGWIGTPYVHQASCLGAGTDCLGLVRGIWRSLYGAEPEDVPGYSRDWGEASGEEVLLRAMERWFVSATGAPAPGDVVLFRMRAGAIAKHLGVLCRDGGGLAFVHAYSGHAVLKTALTAGWSRKIAARFCFP